MDKVENLEQNSCSYAIENTSVSTLQINAVVSAQLKRAYGDLPPETGTNTVFLATC